MKELLTLAITEALQHAQEREQAETSEDVQRPHAALMVEFAQNPNALVYVCIGTIEDDEYYVYVTEPKWDSNKIYYVTDCLTKKEAIESSKITYAKFKKDAKDYNDQIYATKTKIKEEFKKVMDALNSKLISPVVDFNN